MDVREKLVELVFKSLCRHIHKSCKLAENIANDLIADGVTVQEWIPVTERLPELWQNCFVLVKMKYDWEEYYEYNVDAGYYVGENGYIDGFNTFNDWNEGQQYIHVTHWMPLPEPPKGE